MAAMFKRILIILLIIAVTICYGVYQKRSLEGKLVGEGTAGAILARLPSASFQTLEGAPFSLDEVYRAGPVELLVVHYWGTWCAPCEAELPDLLAFIKRFEGRKGVKFLLVAVNDEVTKVKRHLKSVVTPAADVQWLMDAGNVHRDVFGTARVPETYVFSSDKTTLRKYSGPQEWNKPMFFQAFEEFVQMSTRKL